jgi:hypothetical protein
LNHAKKLTETSKDKASKTPPKTIAPNEGPPNSRKKAAAKMRRKLKNDITATEDKIEKLKTLLTYPKTKGAALRKVQHELEFWNRKRSALAFQYKAGVT